MDTKQIAVIRETWAKVVPIADDASRLFYDRLFETDGSAAELFGRTNMAEQRRKLVMALNAVVENVDRLEAVIPTLQDLGKRHVQYGVEDHHYDSVGSALLWTLEQGLGPAFNEDARAAWTIAYALVSGVMRDAAREFAQSAA